jgi:hypothetical protein
MLGSFLCVLKVMSAEAIEPNTDFLNDILTDVLECPPSQACFRAQNTLYAICILLQAALASEAIYSKGLVAIDDVVYECKNNTLPKSLIDKYGFCAGELLEYGYDEQVAKELFWPVVSLLLEVDEPLIEAINERVEGTMSRLDDRFNYYGQVIDTAELEGKWLANARLLFCLEDTAAAATAAADAGDAAAAAEPATHMKHAVAALLKHTRRLHGRRALTPPRSNRPTAYTRHRK